MLDIVREYWPLLLVGQYPHGPLGGLAMTLIVAGLGLLLSLPLALMIAIARVSPYKAVARCAAGLVHVVRGMPLLMLIFWAYFVVPKVTGHAVSGFTTLVCALVIYESAYLSEVIRSGIEAIPKGQIEASRSLGVGYWRTMFKVVLPQALFNVLPSMTSQFVSTVKETSLGYVISVNDADLCRQPGQQPGADQAAAGVWRAGHHLLHRLLHPEPWREPARRPGAPHPRHALTHL